MKKIILVSSVGGHLEQLLSLEEIINRYDSYIITEKNSSTIGLIKKYKKIYFLPYMSRKNILNFILNFIRNFFISMRLFFKINPDVIISTGSACALFMCLIGKVMGRKVIFIETFSRIESKTMTGSICYHIADVFVVQWEGLLKFYPKAIYLGHIY